MRCGASFLPMQFHFTCYIIEAKVDNASTVKHPVFKVTGSKATTSNSFIIRLFRIQHLQTPDITLYSILCKIKNYATVFIGLDTAKGILPKCTIYK